MLRLQGRPLEQARTGRRMRNGQGAGGDSEGLRRRIAELEAELELERAAKRDLADSTDRRVPLVSLLPDAILVHREGKIVFANPLAAALHGAGTAEQLIGRDPLDFIHPDDHGLIFARRKNISDGPQLESLEHRRLRLDGSEFKAKTRAAEISWDGEAAFLVVVRDSTRRERVRKALRDSEARYRRLAEMSPDGIVVETDGVIEFANPSFARIVGATSPEQLFGRTMLDFVVPEQHKEVNERRKKAFAGEFVGLVEARFLRLDGSETHVERVVSAITWRDRPSFLVIVRDINDRMQAEQAQRESEARYRLLAELSPDGIMVHTDGVIVYANPGLAKILGAESPDELIGVHALDLVTPDQREQVMARREKISIGANARLMEGKYLRRDGSETFVERISSQIIWQGKPSYLVLVRDINDRKQAEDKLREREQYIEGMLSHIADAVVTIGQNGEIETFNPSAERMFGYTEEEAVGRNVSILMPQSLRGAHDSQINVYLRTGKSRILNAGSREVMAQRKDGAVFPMEITIGEMAAAGGRAFIGAMRDITARKRAESELRNSEARFRDLIEGSDLGIQIGTREKGRLFANQACAKLFGYDSIDEILAIPRQGVVADYDRDRVTGYRNALLEGDTTVRTYEMDGVRKDGSIIPLQVFLRRIVWEGEAAIQRTFIDLTERKKTEEQLHQAQKMEVVGQLTGGVAHDFNNLLTIILGNLELLDRKLEDRKLKDMARTAIDASRRGAELTQRLLAFSRKQTLAPVVIELTRLVAGMTELLRRTLGKTIEIEVAEGDDPWRCRADPGQLENAILNLALNARDAMPGGGKLTIETSNAKLDDAEFAARNDISPGDYVMVTVSDTGSGMPADVVEHAFEPFFTTKDVGAGSGLGLSMVHGFISQSGGCVTIDSTEGDGATVKLYLPRTIETCAPMQQAPEPREPVSQGEKILVVEDDQEVRAVTVNMLADLGYDTVEASNGREAIEVFGRTAEIDLLFTDVVLPGIMSGIEIAEQAAERYPGIKILLTSGYAETVLDRHGAMEKNIPLIHKPFRKATLAQTLREILDQPVA